MTANAERFTGRVAEYEKYRLRYPAVVMDLLRERCGLRAPDVVADIGAGTGMLAELFLEAGHPVIAVEPNAEMRAACARLQARFAGLRVMGAAAEATGLADASVDMVSAGRAFHWFDRERALVEFRRILKPGGWVVLVSNRRSHTASAQMQAYEALLMEHGTDYSELRSVYRGWEGLKPYGDDAETFEVEMPGEEALTLEELIGQTQSYSVAPLPGDAKYAGMQAALRRFFAELSEGGVVRMASSCQVVGWRTPSD